MSKSDSTQEKSVERKYFGTDGIRGVANQSPLDPETLVRLGKAVSKIFLQNKGKQRILIGKDTRLSGYMIENSLAAGITSMGAEVLFTGPIPTAGLAYLTWSMRCSAGVMISASHNPYQDNGIKIFAADGYKLPDSTEAQIEPLLESGTLDSDHADPDKIGKASRLNDALGRYIVFLKSCFPNNLTLEGIKIGLDCANGAAYMVAPQVFAELGAEVTSRGVSPNGKNINAGFGSLHPEVITKVVLDTGLDLGIALDGDADRAIIVDDRGNLLDGDMILAICAKDLYERGKLKSAQVVATVMSNLGLDKFLSPYGIEVERVQVGDRYVLERMKERNLQIGGEQSGHTIFSDYATCGDGILTALMVLAVMQRSGKKLSELIKDFVRFPQHLVNVKVSKKPALDTLPNLWKLIKHKEEELGSSGRVLVRYSGTENKIRVMVECEDEGDCRKHSEELISAVQLELGSEV
jgi:phosphoglucosamine mutase